MGSVATRLGCVGLRMSNTASTPSGWAKLSEVFTATSA